MHASNGLSNLCCYTFINSHGLPLLGVTRRSVLDIALSWNEFKVSERWLTMSEVVEAADDNRVRVVVVFAVIVWLLLVLLILTCCFGGVASTRSP